MQSEPFDFRSAAQLVTYIESAPTLPKSIPLTVVRVKIDKNGQDITFERSSGDESIDSAIKGTIEEAISKQRKTQELRLDCHIGFDQIPQQSTYRFLDKVWFRPSYSASPRSPGSPRYPRYWSDGKPDLVPYELYVERKLRSDVRGSMLVELVVDRTGKANATLRRSSGNHERDQLALNAVTGIDYEELPNPGPNRIRMIISFQLSPKVVNLYADYDD